MAASMLRLGRLGSLKCLQQESWGTVRTSLTAAFCTKTEEPKKPAKKTKAASKTSEVPGERAALLSYKTAVAFPTRLASPGIISEGFALGKTELNVQPEPGDTACAVGGTIAEPSSTCHVSDKASTSEDNSVEKSTDQLEVTAGPGESTEPKNEESSSSSSSSDSDSDSDSDSEDEKPEKSKDRSKTTAIVVQPEQEGKKVRPSAVGDQSAPEAKTTEMIAEDKTAKPVPDKKTALGSLTEGAPDVVKHVASFEEVPESSAAEDSVDAAPASTTSTTEIVPEKQPEPKTESVTECVLDQTGDKVIPVASTEVCVPTPKAVAEGSPGLGATPQPLSDSLSDKEMEPKVEATFDPVALAGVGPEELVDPAPVITDAAETEAAAAAPEEAAPAPEPEPFDNTTYKNLQHHNYNTYTFVDMDVEMAKHRQPQPSTGRASPRD